MNILLVYPEFPDTFWSFKYALKFVRKKAALPPLGLITIASLLPEEWNKRLVDMNITSLRDADIAWADYVAVSAMTVQKASVRKVIDRCHAAGKKVIAGGPLFTCETDQYGDVDHLVLNEAEITLPAFINDLENGTPKRLYRTQSFPDIRQTPIPVWSLLDLKRYNTMSIQYSRGCPHRCEFCNVTTLFGHRPRTKDSRQIIRELDSLYVAGWRGAVFFVDDNFIGNKRYLKQSLLPALIEWQKTKSGITFNTEATITLADDQELMDLMVKAGFDTVFVGIESPDEDSLIECRKLLNRNRDMIADIKRMHQAGIQVQAGFIVGFDSDTPSIFQRQIDFIQQSGIVMAMVGLLQAMPGTKLYERLKKENRISGETTGDNVDGITNIIPRMNLDVLYEGYQSILKQIYSPRHYYRRVKTFLKEYSLPDITPRLDMSRVMAFFRSTIQLGILGRERFQYWGLLAWTIRYRIRLFPLAITLAIYGYHFRKVCEMQV
jgi:radical SAM superfamily enzyme YgiQ (UPF0313 family)